MHPTLATRAGNRTVRRVLDARRDTLDFRDRMFEATLVEVPPHVLPAQHQALGVPVLDQGSEGACTGFALATVAHTLLRRRQVAPDAEAVSPRMLYEMARRYDEWPGEDYTGSSARGAMKGWHKHGVCADALWPYTTDDRGGALTDARTADALRRPLGAYLRVNHLDLVALHSALAEVGVLFATANVHQGWSQVTPEGDIPYPRPQEGAHAFAIVGYDAQGFWLQNSWGTGWGADGFGRIGYDDWLANATDVWVARLGAPVQLHAHASTAITQANAGGVPSAQAQAELRPHLVSVGTDGQLQPHGEWGTSPATLREIFESDIPRITADWPVCRILLYAHGGLVDERAAVQKLADYRAPLLAAQVYPLAFAWHSDYGSTVAGVLRQALRRRRPEGVLADTQDFLLDRLDDTLELVARGLTGQATWEAMKAQALAAGHIGGAGRLVLEHLARLARRMPVEVHVAAHSAGSILMAPLVRLLTAPASRPIARGLLQGETGYGQRVASCTLWAPATTLALFREAYLPAARARRIARLGVFALTDATEQADHVARIYNKSLLYLVSRAFETRAFGPGTPLAGLERWLALDDDFADLVRAGRADLVLAPNDMPAGTDHASRAASHAAFDDDPATLQALLARILDVPALPDELGRFTLHRSAAELRRRRGAIERQSQGD